MKLLITVMCLLVLAFVACDDDSPTRSGYQPTPPFDNEEAELMALYVSGDRWAPHELYQTIRNDVEKLRSQWADSLEVWDDCFACPHFTNVTFYPPWTPGKIFIEITDSLHEVLESRSGEEWQALMDSLQFTDVEWKRWNDSSVWYGWMNFEGRQHSIRLCEHFVGFPGVSSVSTTGITIGEKSEFIPAFSESIRGYLYDFGWGDCPSGCIYHRYAYFEAEEDTIAHIGTYDWVNDDPDRPEWVTEKAHPATHRFRDDSFYWTDSTASGL